MKECNDLLKFIDSFVYDYDEEKITILDNENYSVAYAVYEKVARLLQLKDDRDYWMFDIALDCVRNMQSSDIEHINNGHLSTPEYHHGYAMYIRNKYIWNSKRHGASFADSVSTIVMTMIFTIVHAYYNCKNQEFYEFCDSYEYMKLRETYWEEYRECFEYVMSRFANESGNLSAREGLRILKDEIKQRIGLQNYKRRYIELMQQLFSEDFQEICEKKDHYKKELENISLVFTREKNQLLATANIDLGWEVRHKMICSFEEVVKEIDVNLGFKEEQTKFIAECIWEANSDFDWDKVRAK